MLSLISILILSVGLILISVKKKLHSLWVTRAAYTANVVAMVGLAIDL